MAPVESDSTAHSADFTGTRAGASSMAFARSAPLASGAERPTSAAQGETSAPFVSSAGFWALIAGLILALLAVVLVFVRWRLSSKESETSTVSENASSSWVALDRYAKLKEMCLDCENPLWNSDGDATVAIPEVTSEEDEVL
jgi:hypothetical protein